MTGQLKTAEVDWHDAGVPVSRRFDDPYFSIKDGLAETQHVFLAGNDLPDRFQPGFHIAELGFGTGLNLLASANAWREAEQTTPLRYTSFEAFPMAKPDIARALAHFPEIADLATEFLLSYEASITEFKLGDVEVSIVAGPAADSLPRWNGVADAWFLDGFSPAKNPELWNCTVLSGVAEHTKLNGTFATYTAAGHVRRNLTDVGFKTERVKGFGRKRHMTIGTKIA